jgi:hypothetical protein
LPSATPNSTQRAADPGGASAVGKGPEPLTPGAQAGVSIVVLLLVGVGLWALVQLREGRKVCGLGGRREGAEGPGSPSKRSPSARGGRRSGSDALELPVRSSSSSSSAFSEVRNNPLRFASSSGRAV